MDAVGSGFDVCQREIDMDVVVSLVILINSFTVKKVSRGSSIGDDGARCGDV